MKKTTKNTGIKVTASVKAGAISGNHTRAGLNVKTSVKAGYICKENHSRLALAVA